MVIGDLKAAIPVIQGGMGVGVSLSGLAGAVSKYGGVGIISTAQIGYKSPEFLKNPIESNLKAIPVECDASEAYKQAYIDACKEDITIIKSPVGMPGRAIRNSFIKKIEAGERFIGKCRQCIKMCNPSEIPFCITDALINAVEGRIDDGLIFCGSNAFRADRIETVAKIMEEFA